MLSTKFNWIEPIDVVVMFAFQMSVENDTDYIEDIIEFEDILCGADDNTQDYFYELSQKEKDHAIARVNALLEVYHEERELKECYLCEELSVGTVTLQSEKNTYDFPICQEHTEKFFDDTIKYTKKLIEKKIKEIENES